MAFNVMDARGDHIGYVAKDFFNPDLAHRFVLVAVTQDKFQPEWLDLAGAKKLLCSKFNRGP